MQSWEEPGCGLAPGTVELVECSWPDRKVTEAQFKFDERAVSKFEGQKNPWIMEETKILWDVGTLCHMRQIYSVLFFAFFLL